MVINYSSKELKKTLSQTVSEFESSKVNHELNRILKMNKHIDNVVKNMRQILSNSKENTLESIELKTLIADLTDLVKPRLISSQFEMCFKTDLEKNIYKFNTSAVIQILTNLINNASDALAHLTGEKEIIVEITSISNYLEFHVIDNGPGIPENLRTKIFESLFTTKSNSGGTGLGLTISKKLAEQIGGSLSLLKSEKGAHFLLKVPVTNTME